jgi:hypothetical protein
MGAIAMTRLNKDLFQPIVDVKKLNPNYDYVRTNAAAEPARIMANEIFQDFPNPDGNFVEQFQTSGFDARTFELYLFAYLSRSGFQVKRDFDRPDFIVIRNGIPAAVEATTVNPKQKIDNGLALTRQEELSEAELQEKLQNELPIRFGSPLFSKLNEKYWELPQCEDLPLVIAIEAFHEPNSLYYTDNSLGRYLYGLRHYPDWSEDGELIVKSENIDKHEWGFKLIPSSFFKQPDTEHISAIMFSNSGTYPKFGRMGFQAGYHRGNITMIRRGVCYDPTPNAVKPLLFAYDLAAAPVKETWGQGLMVFHNPNALAPMPLDFFPDAGQTYIKNGQMLTDLPGFHPYVSQTSLFIGGKGALDQNKVVGLPVESILESEFEAFGPARHPVLRLFADEKEWYADRRKAILGVLLLDKTDRDWTYAILGKDKAGTFRWIDGQVNIKEREDARDQLIKAMVEVHDSGQTVFPQD